MAIVRALRANTVYFYRTLSLIQPAGETCSLLPPRRYKTPAITIPQTPYDASSLCSRAPLNSVYLYEDKRYFSIVGEGGSPSRLIIVGKDVLGCPIVVLSKSK